MFDLIAAGQQVMLLIMAFVFMAVGGLLLGYDIYTRMRGVRVTGTVVGVRETRPNMYRSVYRYSLPSGQSVEAMSSSGSTSAQGRETGRQVSLYAFVDRPDEVSEAGFPIAGLFGGLFFVVGFWPLHQALTHWPVTPLTGLVLAAAVAWFVYRGRGLLIPTAQRKSPRAWIEARRTETDAGLAAVPVRNIEEVLATPAAQAVAASNVRQSRVAAPVLVIVGIGAIGLGGYLGQQLARREAAGLRTPGTVVSLVESSSASESSYYPVVRFRDSQGSEVQFKDHSGSNPPSYRPGEAVTVLYLQASAADSAMIDRGIWNWLPPTLLALFGIVFTFAGVRLLKRRAMVLQ